MPKESFSSNVYKYSLFPKLKHTNFASPLLANILTYLISK